LSIDQRQKPNPKPRRLGLAWLSEPRVLGLETFGLKAFFILKKINSEDTTMSLKGRKYTCVEAFFFILLLLKKIK
jgi:hypothetical protein